MANITSLPAAHRSSILCVLFMLGKLILGLKFGATTLAFI